MGSLMAFAHAPRLRIRIPLFSLFALLAAAWPALADAPRPPVAKRVPKISVVHGDERVDPYYWLREKSDPEVRAYLEAENAYTDAVMRPTAGLQAKLYQEMVGRLKQTDLSVPYRLGGYWYYTRTVKGKQYAIHCRKRGTLDAAEEIILDLNEVGKGHPFVALGAFQVSDDGHRLAYSLDVTGFRVYTVYVKDLRTGRLLPDHIDQASAVNWAADNRTLFYTTDDAAKRPYRLYRHTLGDPTDEMIHEEKDELFRLTLHRSRDRVYNFFTTASLTASEVHCLKSDRPADAWRVVLPRQADHRYRVDHRDGRFYLTTNKGAKNYRLVTAPAERPQPENWQEVVPHRADVLLESVAIFARHAVLAERAGGLPRLRVLDLSTGKDRTITLPEAVCSAFPDANPEFNTDKFRFRYQSLVTPASVYEYDMDRGRLELLKRTEVLGGYDPAKYRTERLEAAAPDGARIPISLVSCKDAHRDGSSPLLLYGYGAYGSSVSITFAGPRVSLVDRGVTFAIAHVRGGKELGQAWHDQGRMLHKRNTFTDFIAAADYLVGQKYTSRDRLVIQGGSAGGLLIGAVLNLRPDLCRAAVLEVPFVDVINTMLDASLPLTVQEYQEWGNPNVKAEYDYIKSYCPYTNLAAKGYPAILVRTSWNDSQVMYWEPAKYVAKLRSLKTDKNMLLLRTNMAGGHGGSSGRYDALKDTAFVYAFILNRLGIKD
jgi:oligopeptidase B